VIAAYNQYHALVIHPDDIWLAIRCQFNFFVNANAELLRVSFVAHEGQRELVIEEEGTRHNVDFADMSRQMAGLLEKNVVDPTLREWGIPGFTTASHWPRFSRALDSVHSYRWLQYTLFNYKLRRWSLASSSNITGQNKYNPLRTQPLTTHTLRRR
jgi:hypothetical protein